MWVVRHKILDQRGCGGCLSNIGTNKGLKDRGVVSPQIMVVNWRSGCMHCPFSVSKESFATPTIKKICWPVHCNMQLRLIPNLG